MSRTADYTIKGFLYQFHKTILEILEADDESIITVEGVIEDIDIATPTGTTAIQCKYHESSTKFQLSSIYKPILQMIQHFDANRSSKIKYVLFAHFPTISDPPPEVGKTECEAALKSESKSLLKYINKISNTVDLDEFLARFEMRFGSSYDDLTQKVNDALKASGMAEDSIETIAYPHAINSIAQISIRHHQTEREITKKQFLENLREIREIAITRWTMALKTKRKLLSEKRKKLKSNLNLNSRIRYFVADPDSIEDFDDEIVNFAREYIGKYHFKQSHIYTPLLCLKITREKLLELKDRFYKKGLKAEDGYPGVEFSEHKFFEDPITNKGTKGVIERAFHFRIITWDDHIAHGEVLNKRKCDDLFIIGEFEYDSLKDQDVNIEHLSGIKIQEFKYIIGLSNSYE
ncbi:MAG: hypothetical protein F6J95_016410 [Leptolyngbya sp. SIO1E4]|nr:hypothetical protein [Leptolyngbya sp. SIO1E4]